MFKVESYISPLLMGYLSKYVKLKPEDFRVSLWGGDAVFHHVQLQYDILEDLMPLPLGFKSGQVHELRIHVPWTKLGSESVVVTLNTVECILCVKSPGSKANMTTKDVDSTSSETSSQHAGDRTPPLVVKSKKSPVNDPDVPPGYLQSFLNRLVNNIQVVVNNLIVKFIEDDIVVSMNVKSVEMFSTDADWMRSFVDVVQPSLLLHRVLAITDMTVCLDRMNSSGHIDTYQDPVLYRCGLTCRVQLKYNNLHSMTPVMVKAHLHFARLEVSVTDTQLPMLSRLFQLTLALYYGTLDLSKRPPPGGSDRDPSVDGSTKQDDSVDIAPHQGDSWNNENQQNQSWTSWAWSFVPQIVPDLEDEDLNDGMSSGNVKMSPLLIAFGIFVEKFILDFKLSSESPRTSQLSSRRSYTQRVQVVPVLRCDLDGIGVQILVQGISFFAAQAGCTKAHLYGVNKCTCLKGAPQSADSEPKCLASFGSHHRPDAHVHFLSGSLFSEPLRPPGWSPTSSPSRQSPLLTSQGEHVTPGDSCLNREGYLSQFTEAFIWKKYGAFWFDYLYTLDVAKEGLDLNELDLSCLADTDGIREKSLKRLFIGRMDLHLSPDLIHRVQALTDCLNRHNYEPYTTETPEVVDFHRPHPTEDQLARLHEFIPTRTFFILFTKPCIKLFPFDHQCGDPAFYLQAQCERLELQLDMPIYPRHLVRRVSRLLNPGDAFLSHCYETYTLRVAGLCTSLILHPTSASPITCPLLAPGEYHLKRRTLLLPMYWISNHLTQDEISCEIPCVTLTVSPPQLHLSILIGLTWFYWGSLALKKAHIDEIMNDVAMSATPSAPYVMDISVSNISGQWTRTHAVCALLCSIGPSLQCSLVHTHSGSVIPVLDSASCFPDTSHQRRGEVGARTAPGTATSQASGDTNALIRLACQLPNQFDRTSSSPFLCHILANGVCGALTPDLLSWLSYHYTVTSSLSMPQEQSETPLHQPSSDKGSCENRKTGPSKSTRSRLSARESRHSKSLSQREKIAHQSRPLWDQLRAWFADNYDHLQKLDLQVVIQPCSLFILPQSPPWHSIDTEATSIKAIISHLVDRFTLPDTFEIILPRIQLLPSAATFTMATDLPLRGPLHSSDKLPWRLLASNLSCQWLSAASPPVRLIPPLTATVTIAATATRDPSPTPLDLLTSLSWCLHADFSAVHLHLTARQLSSAIHTALRTTAALLDAAVHTRFLYDSAIHWPSNPPLGQVIEPKENVEVVPSRRNLPRLTLWFQVTLAKCEAQVTLGHHRDRSERLLLLSLTELTSSIDIQEEYSWVKARMGGVSCKKIIKRSDGCVSTIVIVGLEGDYMRPTRCLTAPSSPAKVTAPPATVHSMASLVLTRALTTDIQHRTQASLLNVALSHGPTEEPPLFPTAEYLNEISLSLEPMDIVLDYELVHEVSTFVQSLQLQDLLAQWASVPDHQPSVSYMQPWFVSSSLPLVYLDLKAVRVFTPPLAASSSTRDTLMVSWTQLSLTPFSANPLPRLVVDEGTYMRGLEAGCLNRLGCLVEDRQYHLVWKGLGVGAGVWNDLVLCGDETDSVQNPALEWNKNSKAWEDTSCLVKPFLMDMDLSVTFAPAIYTPATSQNKESVVCGHSVELNVTSDMTWLISLNDIDLICCHVTALTSPLHDHKPSGLEPDLDSGYNTDLSLGVIPTQPTPKKAPSGLVDLIGVQVTPTNILLTAGCISVLVSQQMKPDHHQVLLHALVHQPHSVIALATPRERIELSAFDMQIRVCGTSSTLVTEDHLLTTGTNGLIILAESRAGRPNPKTGVPPSLYTLTFVNFMRSPGSLNLKIERPLQLYVSPACLKTCLTLALEISAIISQSQTNPTSTESQTNPIPTSQSQTHPMPTSQSSVNPLLASQSHASIPNSSPTSQSALFVAVGLVSLSTSLVDISLYSNQLKSCLQFKLGRSTLESSLLSFSQFDSYTIDVRINLENANLFTSRDSSIKRQVVSPFGLELDVVMNSFLCSSVDTASSQLVGEMKLGMMSATLGMDNVKAVMDVIHDLSAALETLPVNTASKHEKQPSTQVCIECEDELRTRFRLVASDHSPPWQPLEMAVVNSDEDGEGVVGLQWTYSAPKIITKLILTPVPFVFVEASSSATKGAKLKVPCQLQYWEATSRRYTTYAIFGLSEHELQDVLLPFPDDPDVVNAQHWRVLIDCFARYERGCSGEEEVCLVHVSPVSLAACMRVDSLYSPSHVTPLLLALDCTLLDLHILNQAKPVNMKAVEKALSPFTLCLPHGYDEDLLSLHISSLIGQYTFNSLIGRSVGRLGLALAIDCTNYETALLEPLLRMCRIDAALAYTWYVDGHNKTEENGLNFDVKMPLGVGINMSRTGLACLYHTLDVAARIQKEDEEQHSLAAGCIMCNNTTYTIHLQRSDISHTVPLCLASRLCHPWTWLPPLSTPPDQQLQVRVGVSLPGGIVRWGRFLSVPSVEVLGGADSVVSTLEWPGLESGDPGVTLIVTAHTLTNTLTKVMFHGSTIVHNNLPFDLDLIVTSSHGGVDTSCSATVVSSSASPGLCITSPGSLLLRASHPISPTIGHLPWTQPIAINNLPPQSKSDIAPNENESADRKIVKILLSTSEYLDATGVVHSICTTETKQVKDNISMTIITISPMLVVENLMPQRVALSLRWVHSGLEESLALSAQGGREAGVLLNREPGVILSAKDSRGKELFTPPLILSADKILSALKKHQPNLSFLSPRYLCFTESQRRHSSLDVRWPYIDLLQEVPSPRDSLLISIAPWMVVVNLTSLHLMYKQDAQVYSIAKDDHFVPPTSSSHVNLGTCLEDATRWSLPLHISLLTSSNPLLSPSHRSPSPPGASEDVDGPSISLGTSLQVILAAPSYLIILAVHLKRCGRLTCLLIENAIKIINKIDRPLLVKPMFVLHNARPTSLMLAECDLVVSGASQSTDLTLWSATSPVVSESTAGVPLVPKGDNDQEEGSLPSDALDSIAQSSEEERKNGGSFHLLFMVQDQGVQWSLPIKVWSTAEISQHVEGFHMRAFASLPFWKSDSDLSQLSIALTAVSHYSGSCLYLEVSEDKFPDLILHNLSSWDLFFGVAAPWETACMVEEEDGDAGVLDLPLLRQGVTLGYRSPGRQRAFPDPGEVKKHWWRLRFGRVCRSDTESQAAKDAKKVVDDWNSFCEGEPTESPQSRLHMQWSDEIDLYSESGDCFLRVGDSCLLWIQTRPSHGPTLHITINSDHRSNCLATEIRERLQAATSTLQKPAPDRTSLDDRQVVMAAAASEFDKLRQRPIVSKTLTSTNQTDSQHLSKFRVSVSLPTVCVSLLDHVSPFELREFSRFSLVELLVSLQTSQCEEDFVLVLAGGHGTEDPLLTSSSTNGQQAFPESTEVTLQLSFLDIQVCNMAFDDDMFDFPLVLRGEEGSTFHGVLKMGFSSEGGLGFQDLDVQVGPLESFLEDRFVVHLLRLLQTFAPVSWIMPHDSTKKTTSQPPLPLEVSHKLELFRPIELRHVSISQVRLTISLRASLKMFVSSERTPLHFAAFRRDRVYTTPSRLLHSLSMHYVTGTLFRAGWVLGSLDLLGNPTGLVRHLATGVSDLVCLPMAGLTLGPGHLAGGVSRGLTSLLRHTTGGFLGSLTAWTAALARNLDVLSMDEEHRTRQSQFRHHQPTAFSQGLMQGLSGFGLSLLGAVAGIADQPIQALQSQQLTYSGQAAALASGLGKGFLGMLAKPLGGAAEFVAQTGQGFLEGTGITCLPRYTGDRQTLKLDHTLLACSSGNMSPLHILASLLVHLPPPTLSPGTPVYLAPCRILDTQLQSYLLLTPLHLVLWTPGHQVLVRPLSSLRLEATHSSLGKESTVCIVQMSSTPSHNQEQLSTSESRTVEFIREISTRTLSDSDVDSPDFSAPWTQTQTAASVVTSRISLAHERALNLIKIYNWFDANAM